MKLKVGEAGVEVPEAVGLDQEVEVGLLAGLRHRDLATAHLHTSHPRPLVTDGVRQFQHQVNF